MDSPVILIGLATASQCIAKGLPIDALWDDFGVRIYPLIISKGILMDALGDDFGFLKDFLWIPYGFLLNSTCASHRPPMDSQLIVCGFLIDCGRPWIPNGLVMASRDSLWMHYGLSLDSL